MDPGLYFCVSCNYLVILMAMSVKQLFIDPIVQAVLEQQRAGDLLLHLL
jgi:hypothetical protein